MDFFDAWGENNKIENIWLILLFIRTTFAANWNDLPGMRNFLG